MKIFISLIFSIVLSCSNGDIEKNKNIEKKVVILKKNANKLFEKGDLKYELIQELQHDPSSYTQGYLFHNGTLYESSGGYGKSKLMKIDPSTGDVLLQKRLPMSLFAEGIELIGDKIYMLTWKSGLCNIYDLSFNQISQYRYNGEGWGICSDGMKIFTSNGSNIIQVRDIESFAKTQELSVFDENNMPLIELNELEYAAGEIFANVWLKDIIVRIDPNTGEYLGKIDLSSLRKKLINNSEAEALNGIAYNPDRNEFFVTGKNWNKSFLIKLVD